jgi:ubiquitin fusion degradation protein 1
MFPFGGGGGGYHYDDDGYGGGGAAGPAPTGAFTRQFRAYPVSFIDRADLERGDKIVLPPSALDSLARLNISYPMLFQLESREGRKTHCGVLEFVAEEGHANIPYWLMQNLAVAEGGMITIRNASLPKGTYVKFQPQSSDFLDITNPKAVLEATLRGFTCLTKGDAIAISYNDKIYHIDVLEVAPGDAISIIEADVNVEFAAPLDYVEPTPEPAATATGAAWRAGGAKPASADAAERLKKRLARLKKPRFGGAANDDDSDEEEAEGARAACPLGRDSDDSETDEDAGPPAPVFPGAGRALKAVRAGSSGLTFGASGSGGGGSVADAAAAEVAAQKTKEEGERAKARAARAAKFEAFAGSGRTLR